MMDTPTSSTSNNNNSRQVILEGGLPWGFRIQGGSDTGVQLRIARVNPGSKAALQGIREGDVITSMNGQPTEKEVTNSQAHALLKEAGPTLRLGLKQGSTLTRRLFKSSSGASVSSIASAADVNPTSSGNGGVAAQSTSTSHNSSSNGSGGVQSSSSTTNTTTSTSSTTTKTSVLTRSDERLAEENVPERPARCAKNKRSKSSSSRSTSSNNNNNNAYNNSGTEESEDETVDCHRNLTGLKSGPSSPPAAAAASSSSDDPLEGIHSILSEMEREIRHTGIDPQSEAIMAHLPPPDGGASVEPRIGGLTIEEFIHFLALLERVKEQHIDTKESGDDPAAGSGSATPSAPAERTSPYDNIIRSLGPDHPLYCNVATSPRISPPSDEDRSRGSSASSSPCSSDEDAGQFQLPDGKSATLPGFSFLERLFLRRYLHVIPEEVASDCGSHSARLSRALSGLSSALSYLEDVDDDRFSHESVGDEYPDFASGGSLTPVPNPTTNGSEANPVLVPVEPEGDRVEAPECIQQQQPVTHSDSALQVEKARQNAEAESPVDVTERRVIPPEDEFSIVLAVPVMIVDSSDYDDPADSPTEDRAPFISPTSSNLLEEEADRPTHFPQVLDEMNDRQGINQEDEKADEEEKEKMKEEEEEENQSEVTSLADYCELLDESLLPLSVLMMQTSGGSSVGGCCRDCDETTGQRPSHSERNDPPTEDYACSCSLGFSDDDDDDGDNDNDDDDDVNVGHDDNNQQPVIIDSGEVAIPLPPAADGLTGMATVQEEEDTKGEHGPDGGDDTLTMDSIHRADGEEKMSSVIGETTVSGTSVVTLIDAKIVSVDYKPVQLIRSSAQLRHAGGGGTAETLDEFQQAAAPDAENRQLAGENPAETDSRRTMGQVSNGESDPALAAARFAAGDSGLVEATMTKLSSAGVNQPELIIPVDQGVCSSTAKKHGRVVDEMRRLWETRCAADSSTIPAIPSDPDNEQDKDTSFEYGSDQATPVPEEEPSSAIVESPAVVNDPVRMKSIQEFRMLWSGWPPPPPLPPPPEHYGASETETGYSTDGSEPFRQRRRRAAQALMSSVPTPPPRPTPPRDENLYRLRSDHSGWHDRPPEPPLRYQPYLAQRYQPLCYYSAPEADEEEDDERVKARLLADWLVLANRKRSHSPSSGTYRSIQRSNYSTLTSTTTTTRDTSARESESEASDYNDRTDCATAIRRYRRRQRDDEYLSHGSSSSLLSTPYLASSPKPGVWSPGQQQPSSPPERDSNNHQQQHHRQSQPVVVSSGSSNGSSQQQPPPPIWIPSSQQPSPKSERKEFRPVRLEALKKQASAQQQQPQPQQQQQPQQREGGQKPPGGVGNNGPKPAAPTSLPPFATTTSTAASHPSTNAPTTYSSYLYPSSWDNQRQQNAPPYGNNSANSTPINTPASEHSVLTSTSTNFSALSWDRRTNGGSTYSGGSGSTTPTPSLQPLLPPATSSTPTSHLPKVPNTTVTLLQKAREGQLPKGAAYLDSPKQGERSGNRLGQPPPPQQQLYRSPYEQVYSIQREYNVPSTTSSSGPGVSQANGDENSQQPAAASSSSSSQPQETRKFVDLTANKFSGVGPVSNEGVPIALRSGIREEDHHHWYRRMYESLHRAGGPGDYVTVRYKPGRGRGGGYQSEPDQNRYDYDSDAGRYATLDRRRQRIHNDSESNGGSPSRITNQESESYRYQPGRIEDYEPGIRSSITQPQPVKQSPKISIPSKSFTNFALKESGYESDSQLVFRRRYPADSAEGGTGPTTPATDPQEQRLWYRDIQRGGEVPLHGLRKQQPDRPQDESTDPFDRRIGRSEKQRKRDPWRYIRFKSKSPTPPSTQRRRYRFLSVPAVLSRLQSCKMFRSGSSKRQSSATSSPNASEERHQKSTGTSTAKTTVSIGTSTSSKGKTWRRIKSGNGTSGATKKSPKPTAPSPVDGGFVQREETATPLTDDITAVPQPVQPIEPESQELEPLPPPPVEDMHVEQPPLPPPPPIKAPMESPELKQRSTQQRVPSRPALPSFPAFPTLSPLQSRPAKKKSSGSKSEPALNVYLHTRQMVSQSKFRRMQDEPVAQEETPKMTRYQKLARDTKNLVARISGEIPSTEKIRQALKLPAGSNGNGNGSNGNGSNGKNNSDVDVTDPEFICDEQTAAILLAELEGKPESESQKADGAASQKAESPVQQPPKQQQQQPESKQEQMQEQEQQQPQQLSEHYHFVVPLENRTEDGQGDFYSSRSTAGSPEYIKTQRFTQLRSLYRSLERLNELEKLVPTDELNQVASTDGIIDFDLWRRLRQREKAQEEMRNLATWIQAAQREGECYFGTSPPPKWQRGADPGLRIKEQSVRHLTDKYKTLAEAKRYSTQSLPRNFAQCPDGSRAESPVSTGRVSRSSQRRSSLTGKQMAVLKSQLSRVYTPPSRYETVVSPQRPPRKLPESLLNPKLYVRSVSESSRDCTLARLEQRRNRLMESQKALSIAGSGRAVHRSQSASAPKQPNISEAERRSLSMRLGAEVKQRYIAGQPPATPHQQPRSTRAAIQYVQQLSQHMSRKLASSPRMMSPSSPGPYRTHQSRSSSRGSSASSQQDYLLVLTPRGRNKADVESAVQEWADSAVVGKTPSPTPAVPQRSSSLNIRANLEEDSHSSNSSVQTVIHRDVQKKVDFFEKVIADSVGDPCDLAVVPFRTTQSVNDLRRSASTLVGRRRTRCAVVPQRSQSLSLQRPGSSASAYGSMTDLRLHQLMDRVKSSSPSPSGRRSSPGSVSGGGSHYINLVKKGDVVKKCQYFSSPRVDQPSQQQQQPQQQKPVQRQSKPATPQLSSRSVPDSLPLWSATEKFNRNKTVIKGQEMGDVSFIKRRYEQEQPRNRFRSQFGSASTPSLQDGGASGSFSWSRRLAAAANKRVSFPNFSSLSRAGSRNGSDAGSRSGGKKMDFTRVKPTLLSSARLALRQAQTAADPTAHQHTIGGRISRPITRNSSAAGGSYNDIPSTLSSVLPPSNTQTTTTATHSTTKTTVASPDMSFKSTSEGSIRSRRSMSSPLPAIPVSTSAATSNVTPNPPGNTQSETAHSKAVPKESISAKMTAASKPAATQSSSPVGHVTPEADYQPVASSTSHSGNFDPSMHQPIYRYTPPPPRSGGRSNRIHSVYDLYATYPRQRAGMQSPSRPPLPAEWAHLTSPRKPRATNQAGAAHRFAESEVTIHYRSPIRNLQQSGQQQTEIDEEELRQMQAEHMRRVYEQERRRKYIQELEDIESRRHMDNFTPLMKSPIPLNRYDDFMDDQPVPMGRSGSQNQPQRDRTPEPKIVARGLYNFVAQNARELSFQKGDIIFIRRQIDKNWYEGEHNAMVGIFPVNYVEIVPYDGVRLTNRKPSEGKGRVKFNFVAQTPIELSLVKGELVIITRQVDEHWLEGRIGQRRGIFPISYVDIIQPCSSPPSNQNVKTPTTSGTALITNGSLRSTHNYQQLRTQQPQHFSMQQKMSPANATSQHQYRTAPAQYNKPSSLMVDTRSDPVLYRALYTYAPQNDDELELQESDMICVLEKCDDGWYVGTSQRTGLFGTFPGNYVERV